ncbi:MAG TPA: hemolysin III family protein, partial [Microvirga sp.]|nr:hemolysin III family protein [Microvirga sp.]
MDAEFPSHTPAERRADAAVHAAGLALGLAGCAGLAAAALARPDLGLRLLAGLGLYAAGLLAMLACSALYNLAGGAAPARKRLLCRLDHAAIYLMIAGTYTPFALVAIGGAWGAGLLAFVWAVAAGGAAAELLGLRRGERLAVAAYLLLGWSVLPALGPLAAAVSPSGVALLAAGGVLYSAGVVFHLWRRLP